MVVYYETLWQPGTDHAGIATQALVEKKLFSENIDKKIYSSKSISNKLLFKKSKNIEIINAGIPFADSFREVHHIKNNIIKFHPDAIIIYERGFFYLLHYL